jgi:NhaA family Na+:H+ antiporter
MAAQHSSKHWWQRDTAPGVVLVAATILSFVLLNGPLGGAFHHLAINDGLMVIFFLYVGLELKRETVEGPFKNPREAALPMAGALGGMAAPALIYAAINLQQPEYLRGWAIPAATDIAFALGVMSLLGPRVPTGLRLFLLALAIIDDLGAILVIAFFYSTHLVGWALGGAAATFLIMLLMNRAGVKSLVPYWLLALFLWAFMLVSGVHATIAGVLTALTIPMRRKDGRSPLLAAEHALKYWVQFAIMPIFALVNAGVVLAGAGLETLTHSVALGVAAGLVVGKPIGIVLTTFVASLALKQRMPANVMAMFGMAMLAGIGFTMSLFIGNLAFGAGELATPVRFGVLGGSLVSAIAGLVMLWWCCGGSSATPDHPLGADEDRAEARGVIEDLDGGNVRSGARQR